MAGNLVTKVNITLFDTDGYMVSLAGYLCKKCQNIIETRLFTDLEKLNHYICHGKIDVLCASEEWRHPFQKYAKQIPQLIFFSEENDRINHDDAVIFKYQAVPEIVTEILDFVAENDRIAYHGRILSNKTVELLCGYSPFGGAGVTEYLLKMAEQRATYQKVLYINLEEFHGLSSLPLPRDKQGMPESYHRGMSEVLFYLRQKPGKLSLKLESIIYQKGNIGYIFAVENYRDLLSITGEDMEEFLQVLIKQTEYESIFCDIGILNDAGMFLLGKCQKILMPKPKNPIQSAKEISFQKNLKAVREETLLDKREWMKENL